MENFVESRLYKVLNGIVGLTTIIFALIFFVFIIFIYLTRTCQTTRKNLFGRFFSYVTGDTQNSAAKFLRLTVFLLLSAGFVVVVYYNVDKMLTGDPLVSMAIDDNVYSPSILFCSVNITPIQILGAYYYDDFDNVGSTQPLANLSNSFGNIIMGKEPQLRHCMLFNDTLFARPKDKIGGVYNFDLSNNIFLVFIGDFNDVDKSRSFFQGTAHSDIGMQLITSDRTIFTYEETRYKELNGGKVHRCYRINHVGGLSSEINTETNNIVVIAPAGVILATEEPPLDLTTFFGNIGGFLTICGIYGFLFGSGKMNPFGFVTEYCFQYRDLDNTSDKVGNDVEKGDDDKDRELEAKFETLFRKYYVDMKYFESKNQSFLSH